MCCLDSATKIPPLAHLLNLPKDVRVGHSLGDGREVIVLGSSQMRAAVQRAKRRRGLPASSDMEGRHQSAAVCLGHCAPEQSAAEHRAAVQLRAKSVPSLLAPPPVRMVHGRWWAGRQSRAWTRQSSQSTSARESLERAYASVVIKSLLIKGGRELRETTNCWMLDLARPRRSQTPVLGAEAQGVPFLPLGALSLPRR